MTDGLAYGTISWQAMMAVADTDDPDLEPDIVAVPNGQVTITPSVPRWLVVGGTPPKTLFAQALTLALSNGQLMDGAGNTVIPLLADAPGVMTPTDWTYHVEFVVNDKKAQGSFDFTLAPGQHVDLTTVVPVTPSEGTPVIVGPKGDRGDPGLSDVMLKAGDNITLVQDSGDNSVTISSTGGGGGGEPTTLTIGTVTTLPEGSQATATIYGVPPLQFLDLGIPVGGPGADGPAGPAGPDGAPGPAGPGVLVLSADAEVPAGTPANTVIFRTAS